MNLNIVASLISSIVASLREASTENEGGVTFSSDDIKRPIQFHFHSGTINRAQLIELIDLLSADGTLKLK